jgi:hypothetical protein
MGMDLLFPYAPVYKTPLLLVTVFLPSLIAFSALLNRSIPRWIVVPAAAGSLVLLLVSTGLHGPDPFYNANQFFSITCRSSGCSVSRIPNFPSRSLSFMPRLSGIKSNV